MLGYDNKPLCSWFVCSLPSDILVCTHLREKAGMKQTRGGAGEAPTSPDDHACSLHQEAVLDDGAWTF